MILSMRFLRWPVAFAFVIACAACVGDGTGAVAGTLYLRGCSLTSDFGSLAVPKAYDMRPTFFVADPINVPQFLNNGTVDPPLHPVNKVTIRVEPSGKTVEQADLLYIDVADDAQVVAAAGQPMEVGPTTVVRASLTLSETCPDAEVVPELDGTLTFTSFGSGDVKNGIQFGDRLAADFSFDVVDRRQIALGGVGAVPTDPATAGHIAGNFSFIVRQGKAGQDF
jgi:hypothetical protein